MVALSGFEVQAPASAMLILMGCTSVAGVASRLTYSIAPAAHEAAPLASLLITR